MFYEKELQKTNQQTLEFKKELKQLIDYLLNGKVMIIRLIAKLIKNIIFII